MPNTIALEELLAFLTHAGNKGLMPVATAQALAVATRNVFAILDDDEKAALPLASLDAVIKRFETRRARDFNPSSLREYGRRTRRAIDLFTQWRDDPANFSVPTRATNGGRKRETKGTAKAGIMPPEPVASHDEEVAPPAIATAVPGALRRDEVYTTSFPVRPGLMVTLANIPFDLTPTEAERLAGLVRLLASE